jgi:hypothetical protein
MEVYSVAICSFHCFDEIHQYTIWHLPGKKRNKLNKLMFLSTSVDGCVCLVILKVLYSHYYSSSNLCHAYG